MGVAAGVSCVFVVLGPSAPPVLVHSLRSTKHLARGVPHMSVYSGAPRTVEPPHAGREHGRGTQLRGR